MATAVLNNTVGLAIALEDNQSSMPFIIPPALTICNYPLTNLIVGGNTPSRIPEGVIRNYTLIHSMKKHNKRTKNSTKKAI